MGWFGFSFGFPKAFAESGHPHPEAIIQSPGATYFIVSPDGSLYAQYPA
jgi:hypothetical protein